MRTKIRLSPYPILDNYGDDYENSSFTVKYDVNSQFLEVYGKLKFDLQNHDIQKLIDDDKAQFAIHIECPLTSYRSVLASRDSEIEFKIDSANVSKLIEITTFIVLKEDVTGFCSDSFHPDYQGEKFDLKKHQIIAIGTACNFEIQKDDRDIDALPSIIKINKLKDLKKGSLSVNTDQDEYIIIGLTEDVFELYARLGKNKYKATAFSLVLLPAFVIVLQRMYINRNDEAITSMHWYQVISNMLERNDVDIENLTIENDSLLSICQSIFADPIARSFKELRELSERM